MRYLTGLILFSVTMLTAQHTVTELGMLDVTISESSGLLFFNDRLITHNDSGNEAILYEIDTTSLTIVRQVTVINVENKDWEALTQDETHIYIGDFGNNVGTRTDLSIYKIDKNQYLEQDQVVAEIIEFRYEDQTEFDNDGNSDWDAEAFIAMDNQLVVLTKQWQSLGSVAYSIPKIAGNHLATRIGEISDIGLVTDATFDNVSNELFVLGYSSILTPFLLKFENAAPSSIFNPDYQEYELGLSFVQTEGITRTSENQLYFTSEFFSRQTPAITSEARIFNLEFVAENNSGDGPNEPEVPDETPENETEEAIIIYRDASLGEFLYTINTTNTVFGGSIFDSSGRMVWTSEENIATTGYISRSLGRPGIFYFAAYLNTGILSVPFALY
ncbi:hypothetical protein PP182_08170 [Maribacter sp. PR1]|uniref:Secretion protein n=1 Tax=Maribacter cobaltidurans TaxID=1178778 RepID=A0ABU7IST6_9FLAO|nr:MULTISPECIES: hypothetical protein [Maribacter]MDC6388655.1 hypothetical protein [Maribacter sp. PR1]MEE1976044.1 hypothetical protein [Maribacter cobaltidurans]